MKAWVFWMFRGYRLLEKLTTAALDPNGSLAMAWRRIEALERQNAQLAANMLDARREAESAQENLSRVLRDQESVFRKQFDDLRRLIIAREPEKPAPKQARNWREVQQHMEEVDVPAR